MNKILKKNEYAFPFNLIHALLDKKISPEDLPSDVIPALYYILLDLTDRQKKIIELYFEDGNTYSEIAVLYGLTTERVRQIVEKAIRILRAPHRIAFIQSGLKGSMKILAKQEYERGYTIGYAQAKKDCGENITSNLQTERNVTIEEMDLSVRAYNCLCRANLRTSDDIARCDYFDLIKIRNLGRHTLFEIITKLNEMGYETAHMREPVI